MPCLKILQRTIYIYINQIVLLNGFPSGFVEITSFVYTKTIILFNFGEKWP